MTKRQESFADAVHSAPAGLLLVAGVFAMLPAIMSTDSPETQLNPWVPWHVGLMIGAVPVGLLFWILAPAMLRINRRIAVIVLWLIPTAYALITIFVLTRSIQFQSQLHA